MALHTARTALGDATPYWCSVMASAFLNTPAMVGRDPTALEPVTQLLAELIEAWITPLPPHSASRR
jgi:hypothetical protein